MWSALHSPAALIAARILPSHEGERWLLVIAKRPKLPPKADFVDSGIIWNRVP